MSDFKFNETFEEIFPNGITCSKVGNGGVCSLNFEQIEFVVCAAERHDTLTNRVKELKEALNLAQDALAHCKPDFGYNNPHKMASVAINKALEGGDEV